MKKLQSQQKPVTTLPRLTASPTEICSMFGLNEGTMANLRSKKKGPKFYRVGKKVLYRIADVETWISATPILTTDSLPCKYGGSCSCNTGGKP